MSAHRNSVKPNFQTGDYPTQAQFYDWLDWTVFDDEFDDLWWGQIIAATLGNTFTPGVGTIGPTDTVFTALEKIIGNQSVPLTSPILLSAGTNAAYTVANTTILNYSTLQEVTFKAHIDCIDNATVNFNGKGALTMKISIGTNVLTGYITNGLIVKGVIDGSDFKIISVTPNMALIF